MSQIILFNKPYGVLSQFTPSDKHPGLKGYIPLNNVYPAGRLDQDSEGLLILTSDGELQARISHPKHKLPKTYLVEVDGEVTPHALQCLSRGVALNDGTTLPAIAVAVSKPNIWSRTPPVRIRKSQPTSWLQLTIREGRNRQVRRMTASVGFPTLRLIRTQVGPWKLNELLPGEYLTETVHLPAKRSDSKANRNRGKRLDAR